MAKHFVVVWLVYWAAIAIMPVHSVYPATGEAFLLQLTFVILVIAGYGVAHIFMKIPNVPHWGAADILDSKSLIYVAFILSFVGTGFLVYDKMYVQGIDYSQGIAFAREEWRRVGEDRGGNISSIFSVLGYLFSSGYFVAGILTVVVKKGLSQRFRFFSLLCVFLLLMANSLISGGRSNVLLLVTLLLATISSQRGWSFRGFITDCFARIFIYTMILLAAVYTLYVFYERADASGLTAVEYVVGFLPYLGLEIDKWYLDILTEGSIASLSAVFLLAMSYVAHSFSTTAAIIDGIQEDKVIVFLHVINIFNKLGLVSPPDSSWFLAGRFPSLPGALWYQYGGLGIFFGGFSLGIGCALAKFMFAVRAGRVIPLSLYVASYAVLVLSPMLLVMDFMSFPFVLLSFVQVAMLRAFIGCLRVGFRKPIRNMSN